MPVLWALMCLVYIAGLAIGIVAGLWKRRSWGVPVMWALLALGWLLFGIGTATDWAWRLA